MVNVKDAFYIHDTDELMRDDNDVSNSIVTRYYPSCKKFCNYCMVDKYDVI